MCVCVCVCDMIKTHTAEDKAELTQHSKVGSGGGYSMLVPDGTCVHSFVVGLDRLDANDAALPTKVGERTLNVHWLMVVGPLNIGHGVNAFFDPTLKLYCVPRYHGFI